MAITCEVKVTRHALVLWRKSIVCPLGYTLSGKARLPLRDVLRGFLGHSIL